MSLPFSFIAAFATTNMRNALANRKGFAASVFSMAASDILWFCVWWIFFAAVPSVGGWQLADIARFNVISMMAYGWAFFIFGGAWSMSSQIQKGYLDVYLTYPRFPLVCLILSKADPQSIGDLIAGIFILIVFGNVDFWGGMAAMGFSIVAALIILAVCVTLHSCIFWGRLQSSVLNQLFDSFIFATVIPAYGLPMWIKAFLFTVFPAAFVAFVPTEILRDFSWWKMGAMASVALISSLIAIWTFNMGLRRYTSGNRMLELR